MLYEIHASNVHIIGAHVYTQNLEMLYVVVLEMDDECIHAHVWRQPTCRYNILDIGRYITHVFLKLYYYIIQIISST